MANRSDLEERYDLYIKERETLINAGAESARSFDKGILTLAAGAFVVSIAFLKDVAPQPQPATRVFMLLAWICFGLSLLSVLLSFLTSQEAYRAEIPISYEFIVKEKDTKPSRWSKVTRVLNLLSILFFIIAASFWAWFVYRNFQ